LTTSQQRRFREYAAVVMRLLNRERAGRFSSAREALEAIESVTPFQECPHCGERLPEHFKYCGYCGGEVVVQPTPSLAPPEATPTADELVEEGFLLSRDRRWADAIARYNEALKLEPDNQKALRNLGFALNRIRKHDEALRALSKGLELEVERPAHESSLRYERSVALTELKQYDAAMEDVARALALQPMSTKALYLRARIHLYRGDFVNARRDALEVLRVIPDHNGALRLVDQVDTRAALEPNKRLQPTGA
jgi:tetratricopeptide (TPR) repeat protein